jgi:hypothetical protein
VPKCIIQDIEEQKFTTMVQGTTKAAVLHGDNECPDVVAFNDYDTKPLNFLSAACPSLKWRGKTKKVFDKNAGVKVLMYFLYLNVTDDYKHVMNNVDQTDHL